MESSPPTQLSFEESDEGTGLVEDGGISIDLMVKDVSVVRQLSFDENNGGSELLEDGGISMDLNLLKDVNVLHSRMPVEMIPKVGMELETEEAALEFYKAYSRQVGFGIRKQKSHKDKDGNLLDRTFTCCAQGRRKKDKRDAQVKRNRPETRFGCLARMRINKKYGKKFRVTEFEAEHTHYLSSPNKTHMIRAHRKISPSQAVEIEMANSVGIAPKTAHNLMVRQAGGRDNLGFVPVDYRNHLRSKREKEMEPGDTGGVLEYLHQMQFEDPNFFYAIQVDEEDAITNIFWSDAKMRSDFANFGDVVSFDTTYRKNNEGRPIALFVGVNHHKQTTIFGIALMYDETTQSFQWLFDTFSKAMLGAKPRTILTDQDPAMAGALASRWPETQHWLCIWHIYQNAAIHLSSVFSEFPSFRDDFSTCIYDFDEEEDFFREWNSMLDKYELQDNAWLKRLFEIREKWALVYGRQMFCADMTTTQRSESMNMVLKRYVSYKHKFLEFFNKFDLLLENRRYDELKADFKSKISCPSLTWQGELLKHAAKVYTPEVYDWFQGEWCKSIDAIVVDCGQLEGVSVYKITPHKNRRTHTVKCDANNDTFVCSCKKFEFAGILCCHVMKIFSMLCILRIPEKYILKRWSRNAKVGQFGANETVTDTSKMEPQMLYRMRYKHLCHLYVQLATKAAESEATYLTAKDHLVMMIETVDASLQGKPVNSHESNANVTDDQPAETIAGENPIKIKGIKVKTKTKSGKRRKNALEKLVKKRRNPPT